MSEEQPYWVLVYLSPYELSHFSVGQTHAYYLVKGSLHFVESLNLDSTLMHGQGNSSSMFRSLKSGAASGHIPDSNRKII